MHERVAELLQTANDSGKDEEARKNTIFTLGLLSPRDPETAAGLVTGLIGLLTNSDKDICDSAAASLGYLGNAKAVKPLIKLLKTTDDEITRYSVIHALHQIAIKVPNLGAVSREIVKEFRRLLEHKDTEVRIKAIEGIALIQQFQAIPLIAKAMNDNDPIVREFTAETLKGLYNPSFYSKVTPIEYEILEGGLKALKQGAGDAHDTAARAAVVSLLSCIMEDDNRIDGAVLALLGDQDKNARKAASAIIEAVAGVRAMETGIALEGPAAAAVTKDRNAAGRIFKSEKS